MSQMTDGKRRTFKAGSGLTAAQYCIVKQDTDGTVILATAGTDVAVGVLNNKPAAGDNASVILRSGQGTTKVVASTSIAIGAKVTATTGGQAVTTTTDKDEVVGIALEAATAQGDVIEILLANYTLSHA